MAITRAIDSCIEKGILGDVLRKNRAEVLHMFLTEYDEKKHMNAVYKEGYEEGEQAGERNLLERKVRRKLQQGKGAAEIAKELDEEMAVVEEIISSMKHSF